MSLWRSIFEGFAEGAVTAAAYHAQTRQTSERNRIERLCSELGWSVDERNGKNILLHFNDPVVGVRKVRIVDGDDDVVLFTSMSRASIPANQLPPDALAYLLCRNIASSCIGMWGMLIEDHIVSFHVMYSALGDGLDAPTLKYICQSLASEAADLDDKLRAEGLL